MRPSPPVSSPPVSTPPVSSTTVSSPTRSGAGLVFLIGSDPDRPGELLWPALAALAAADAVVHDPDIDPVTLALAPPGCLVEPAAGDIARIRKLAGDGWRVVWLLAGDPAASGADRGRAERLAAGGVAVHAIAGFSKRQADSALTTGEIPAPHFLATALNGLAG